MSYHRWTTGDEAFLRGSWGALTLQEIAAEIGVSEESLKTHALRMGLTQTPVRRPHWSREEDALVRLLAQRGRTAAQIGDVMGRGAHAVRNRMRRLGV